MYLQSPMTLSLFLITFEILRVAGILQDTKVKIVLRSCKVNAGEYESKIWDL